MSQYSEEQQRGLTLWDTEGVNFLKSRKGYKDALKEYKKLQDEMEKYSGSKHVKEWRDMKAKEKELQDIRSAFEDSLHGRQLVLDKLREEANYKRQLAHDEARYKQAQTNAEAIANLGLNSTKMLLKAAGDLKTTLDNTMDSFLEKQEAMAYNLIGTGTSLTDITNQIRSGYLNRYLDQSDLYNNLTDLVGDGLAYSSLQTAALQTLSKDLGMTFNASSGTLPRLFALQKTDQSSFRMAIEADLKEFLNENYETSTYIKDSFQSIADSLLEAQSMMSDTTAMKFESTVQKWLGSWSSSGLSTTTASTLASALSQLGSGDVSNLVGSDINNLIMLGAQRSGLSYSDLLLNGLNESNTNLLFSGMLSYLSEFSSDRNNVVYSAIAELFGMSVSDLKAAANLMESSATVFNETISTDINSVLLGKLDNYVYKTSQISNILDNVMYDWAIGVAGNEDTYMAYKVTDTIANIASTVTSGLGFSLFAEIDTSDVLKNIGLVTVIPQLLTSLGTAIGPEGFGWADENNLLTSIGGGLEKFQSTLNNIFKNLGSNEVGETDSSLSYTLDAVTGTLIPTYSTTATTVTAESTEASSEDKTADNTERTADGIDTLHEDIQNLTAAVTSNYNSSNNFTNSGYSGNMA